MQDNNINNTSAYIPEPKGIVSVNKRGGSSSDLAGKVIFVLVVLAILAIGGLIGFNKYRAAKKAEQGLAEQTSKNENKPAAVGQRRIFDTDPPPLPSGAKPKDATLVVNTGQGCADNSPGQVLLGQDGKLMLAPSGQPMRVCKNGQVFVPALQGTSGDPVKPIGIAGSPPGQGNGTPPPSRYAGDVIVPAASNIIGNGLPAIDQNNPYVKALLATTQGSSSAPGFSTALSSAPAPQSSGTGTPNQQGSIGSLLQGSQTPAVSASMIGDRNMILPKGRTIDCNLSTRVINEVSGMASCVFSSNVYSDNGRVVLAERGSEATGEYVAAMTQGQRRLFVLWTRIKTPRGVVVNINSPTTDSLGTSGIDGYIDNRWPERIGAAFLLSFVQDAIGYETAKATAGSGGGGAQGVAVFQNTSQNGSNLAQRVLESTINIKPTLYKNQGDRTSIFVARDVDFGTVYALRAN